MIEVTLNDWLGNLPTPLYPLAIPDDKEAPGIVYRIESEFTPSDDNAPFGALGHRIRLAIWHKSYKSASIITSEIRTILRDAHKGYLVSIEDRGDYQDLDTNLYGIVLDVEVTVLLDVEESVQAGFRGAVKERLLNRTNASENIYATRIGFSNSDSYPKIGISIESSDIETGNADQEINASIELDVKTYSTIDSENQLEILVDQIERHLSPDTKLNNEPMEFNLQRITSNFSNVGRLHFEHRKLAFNVKYFSNIPDTENAPGYENIEGAKVPEYRFSGVQWNIDKDTDPEATEIFEFPNE
jgi:hypothetical protein